MFCNYVFENLAKLHHYNAKTMNLPIPTLLDINRVSSVLPSEVIVLMPVSICDVELIELLIASLELFDALVASEIIKKFQKS